MSGRPIHAVLVIIQPAGGRVSKRRLWPSHARKKTTGAGGCCKAPPIRDDTIISGIVRGLFTVDMNFKNHKGQNATIQSQISLLLYLGKHFTLMSKMSPCPL